MKIYACIAEYNPFHNGHLKLIEYMKKVLKADKIIILMSGNFTQRGDFAVLDKFTRASHAIKGGADLCLELPTVFATANAENFALGACKLLNSIGNIDGLCFGIESGTKEEYISLARELNCESKEYKKAVKENLDSGVSLAKAKFLALEGLGKKYDEKLISSPNNILALEYTKALLKLNSKIEIFPFIREGDHNDEKIKKGITSATSIREALKSGKKRKTKKCVPKYVYKDLTAYNEVFEKLIMGKVVTAKADELEKIADCTEGLHNRIKALSRYNIDLNEFIEKVSTKRYTKARIRRILISNLLGVNRNLLSDCLKSDLYLKVLAVKKESKDVIPLIAKNTALPILTRKSDYAYLKGIAKESVEIDATANDLYNLATDKTTNEHIFITV